MVTWLECEMVMASGKKMVRSFKCSVCSKYRIRKESSRNFSDRWIVGANHFAQAIFETTEKTVSTR